MIVDAQGIPLALTITGAQRHDSMAFESLLDTLPAIPGLPGRPGRWPDKLHADKAYDFPRRREHLHRHEIRSRIARRGIESAQRLGKHRRVVERTLSWFSGFDKLRIRFERRADIHIALLKATAAIICLRFVERFC